MNFSIKRHLIDLIPLFTLGGVFKVLIIPNWDNMTYTNPITIHPIQTALLVLGWSSVMAILYYWKKLHRKQDNKKLLAFVTNRIKELHDIYLDENYTTEAQKRAFVGSTELINLKNLLDETKRKLPIWAIIPLLASGTLAIIVVTIMLVWNFKP